MLKTVLLFAAFCAHIRVSFAILHVHGFLRDVPQKIIVGNLRAEKTSKSCSFPQDTDLTHLNKTTVFMSFKASLTSILIGIPRHILFYSR